MKRLTGLIIALLAAHAMYGQTIANITLSLKENAATRSIPVDTAGVVYVDTLDGVMRIDIPDTLTTWSQYSIQFNSDTTKFTVAFDCSGSDGCIAILGEYIKNRHIFLTFQKGLLVGIGDGSTINAIYPGKPVAMVHPYIKMVRKKPDAPMATKPKAKLKGLETEADDPSQRPLALNDTSIAGYKFDCPDTCGTCRSNFRLKRGKDSACCDLEVMRSVADRIFLTPCLDKHGNALSIDYVIVNDTRDTPSIPTPLILKLNKKTGFEYLTVIKQTDFKPHANQGIAIAIIRPRDTVYTVNSVGVDFFLSQGASFANITPSGSSSPTTSATTPATTSTGGDQTAAVADKSKIPVGGKVPSLSPLVRDAYIEQLTQRSSDTDIVLTLLNSVDTASLPGQVIILNYLKGKVKEMDTTRSILDEINLRLLTDKKNLPLSDRFRESYRALARCYAKAYVARKDSVIKGRLPAAGKTDSAQYWRDSASRLSKALTIQKNEVTLKVKLMGLYASLVRFNNRHGRIDLDERRYGEDLICLKKNIEKLLNIPAAPSDSLLSSFLTQLAQTSVDSMYFKDFRDWISDISTQYAQAIHKTPTVALYYYSPSVKVPKSDSLNITIKKQSGAGNPINLSFPVWGGCKIDFSTGVFVNGLRDITYTLGQHTFRYKVTSDTVLPNGTDSIRYGGVVKDTTGNLIHSNSSKLNYTIGVLAHIYRRSGRDVNWGGVAGVMLDNNSKVLFVGGASLMFKAGKNRISLTVGGVVGQQSCLTSVNSQYKYDSKSQPDYKIYGSVYEVPRFYTGSNEITTNTVWKLSWYAGITYNISVN